MGHACQVDACVAIPLKFEVAHFAVAAVSGNISPCKDWIGDILDYHEFGVRWSLYFVCRSQPSDGGTFGSWYAEDINVACLVVLFPFDDEDVLWILFPCGKFGDMGTEFVLHVVIEPIAFLRGPGL